MPGRLGELRHSPQTVEFVSGFAAEYYEAFKEEYETVPSVVATPRGWRPQQRT